MWTYSAERVVTGDAPAVRAALAEVVASLWPGRSRLVAEHAAGRVDAVMAPGEDEAADVWLTWELVPVAGGTRVRLGVDEVEPGPDPASELQAILDLLARRVADCPGTPSGGPFVAGT